MAFLDLKFFNQMLNFICKSLEGSCMIKYAKKVILRKFYFKKNLFSTFTFNNIFQNYLSCILKSLNTSLDLL